MSKINTVHLIGLGAVGATYASYFYNMDKQCINVIVDENRLNKYKDSYKINGERYDFNYVIPKMNDPKAELIVIAVKGHHLKNAIKMIEPLIGQNTIILSLLNGIFSEDILSNAFGRDKVLHGFCVGLDSLREKEQVRFATSGQIVFGEYYKEVSGKAASVAEFLIKAGISYTIPNDIRREMWWKFMMNVGINQTSAVLKAPYGVYHNIPEAMELMTSACMEVIPLAELEEVKLSKSDISKYLEVLKSFSPEGKTSMLQDVEASRKTEVEIFSLAVIELGKKHGIPTPVNEMLYRMIKVLEARY